MTKDVKTDDYKYTKSEKKFIIFLALFSACTILLNCFVVQLANVNGDSMNPTLKDGQILLMSKLNKDDIDRGDIIVFRSGETVMIKRVIGLPGETVQIKNNNIYINNEKIEDYVDVEMTYYGILSEEVKLGKDEFICLGDNRNNSKDSRNNTVGKVKQKEIMGKIIFRFLPATTF